MGATYIDTHCHLNFSRFKKTLETEVSEAVSVGVTTIIVPGTDIVSSKKAIEVAHQFPGLYAAVGIHPHHIFELQQKESSSQIEILINELEKLIVDSKTVAVGEVGLDSHVYDQTKYKDYSISPDFLQIQQELLEAQIQLALRYNKTLILHNRETKTEMLSLLRMLWSPKLEKRSVFHCCEPDADLLTFAREHHMYIGVDGDVTYGGEKAEFIRTVPLDMLVLETDSPFLLPEPLRGEKKYPNGPRNIPLIAAEVARLQSVSLDEVAEKTTNNAEMLFALTP